MLHQPFCSSLHSTQPCSSGQAVGCRSVFIAGMCPVPPVVVSPTQWSSIHRKVCRSPTSLKTTTHPGFGQHLTPMLFRGIFSVWKNEEILAINVSKSTHVPTSAARADQGSSRRILCAPAAPPPAQSFCPGLQLLSQGHGGHAGSEHWSAAWACKAAGKAG